MNDLAVSDPTISRWRGVFVNDRTEDTFRVQSAKIDSVHAARGLLLLAAANIFFFLGDLSTISNEQALMELAISRTLFLTIGIVAFFALRRNSDTAVLDRSILIFAVVATLLMTFQLREYIVYAAPPPALFDIMLTYLVVIPATYLLLANPISLQIAISGVLTASFIYILQYDIPQYDAQLPFAITILVLVNIVGITTSSRRHELRRQAWWLLNGERAARKRLENEISLRQSLEQELRHMATTDDLTGISNRRHFYMRAEAEIIRARRYDRKLAILEFDLDNFKGLNDAYGHPFGDEVLKSVVDVVSDLLRANDLFARVGGEEFAIALPETDEAFVPEIAERIRQTIEETEILFEGKPVTVTASIGIALLTPDDKDIETVISRADKAMYQAKNDGRNRVISAR